jgi:hypothetical protein
MDIVSDALTFRFAVPTQFCMARLLANPTSMSCPSALCLHWIITRVVLFGRIGEANGSPR